MTPELPEVETIRRGLENRLVGRTVTDVYRSEYSLRRPSPLPLSALRGRRIDRLRRHAKMMFWDLDGGTLVSHLGMTGKWTFHEPNEKMELHTHLRLMLDDGSDLRYRDVRRFGWLALHAPDDPPLYAAHYGMDALDPNFTDDDLSGLLASSLAPLKSFLLDQTKISGLGNIYACEALWRAQLSPRRKAKNTPKTKIGPLRRAMVQVLQESLAAGGTSFNDYVDSIGRKGSFWFDLDVFQRAGQPCSRCGGEVRRMVQSGRSTFYCPGCQK